MSKLNPETPKTTMVYCPPCMKHWEAPAREDYWNARTEPCPRHQRMRDEGITEEDIADTLSPTVCPENR